MPDHRIGISLDVKNGGTKDLQSNFESVAKSAETIKQRFADLDKATSSLVRKGWGSQQYTQELRSQLSMLQQMATLAERRAARAGNLGVQGEMQGLGRQIGGSYRDVGAVRGASMPSSAEMLSTATTIATTALAATLAGSGIKLLTQGYGANVSMLPAFANMGRTMAPGGGTMGWAQSMLKAGQGYGYTNAQILSGAQTIQGAAGNTPNFFNQIRGVAQFGRQNGFDYQSSANYFAGAYKSGVTGGTGAQMSWQEYAILVANTVNAGNMQGRNGQVVDSLQQLTQMAQQTMLTAPNQQAVGALYATATKSGNQALINQFPSIMSGVNQGIQSPGMGAYGQAAMWQALAPGANYWHAQMIESQGAFGTGDNGKTNFQNALTYANKNFGGNTDQGAYMTSQFLGGAVSPAQAKMLMDTYMVNGKFNTVAFNANLPGLEKQIASPLQQNQQNYTAPGQNAQGASSGIMGPAGWLYNAVLGNTTGQVGAAVIGGAAAQTGLMRMFGKAGISGIRAASLGTAGSGAVGAEAVGGAAVGADAVGGALGVAGGLEGAGALADATGVGLPIGLLLALAGGGVAAGAGGVALYNHFKGKGGSGGSGDDQFNVATAAQETAAILMALRPYMGEIGAWLGQSGSGGSGGGTSNTNLTNTNTVHGFTTMDPVSLSPGKDVTPPGLIMQAITGSSTNGNVGGISKWASQINATSSKYGVPAQVLGGIMATESGGNPYSLYDNTAGKSYSFNNQSQYMTTGQQLLSQGHKLDMGLMQIDSGNGVTLAQASNTSWAMNYAANMLQQDYQSTGDWNDSIRAYNGGLGGVNLPQTAAYLQKVQSAESQIKVNSTGQLVITVNDASTGKKTKTMVHLTSKATTNGQFPAPRTPLGK